MKFSQLSLLTAAVATVNGAVVTVTQHVHQGNPAKVQGIVYVENGETRTTYSTVEAQAQATAYAEADASEATAYAEASVSLTTSSEEPVETSSAEETTSSESVETTSSAEETTSSESVETTSSSSKETTTVAPTTSSSSSEVEATSSSSSEVEATSSSGSSDFASQILEAHNNKRSLHKDTPSLSWSDELASYAQDYADKYDCSGTLTHSGGKYGENLAVGYDATGSVDAWYNEIDSYDYSNPTFSSSTGHFTQVVWKSSTELGCGIKKCGSYWGSYVICSYNPAGNYLGKFADNVEPLK